jgi:geranylgeranyl diphosphate synthase type II
VSPDFRAFLDREVQRVETALSEIVKETIGRGEERARGPLAPALIDAMRYALETRGKRLRPILCCAAFRSITGDEPSVSVYGLACALEIVHTYSLVHDDLPCMDDDDLRRGRPTVHRVHGAPLATLSGAVLIPLAIHLLEREAAALGLDEDRRTRLVSELCTASGAQGMVAGQLLDLMAEDTPVDAAGLEKIHRAKTGALLAASLRIGALAARGTEAQLDSLTVYGEAIGLAFQIVDDILDVTAASDALGKTAGRDISLGKATYPSLFGVDGARALAEQWAAKATSALDVGGIESSELRMLARFVVERGR